MASLLVTVGMGRRGALFVCLDRMSDDRAFSPRPSNGADQFIHTLLRDEA